MPTLEYYRRTSEVGGSPVYLSVQASISNLFINRMSTELRGSYGRLDLHPVFSFPWKSVPWLSVTATAGGRWTGYTNSTTDALQTSFEGSTAVRAYGEAGVSIVGPSFSRIYDGFDRPVREVQARHRAARRLPVRLGRQRTGAHPRLRRHRHAARPEPGHLRDRQPSAGAPGRREGRLGDGDRFAGDLADVRFRGPAGRPRQRRLRSPPSETRAPSRPRCA